MGKRPVRNLVDAYVECVARVRMLERGLLTRADLEHALARTSAEEVLSDSRFLPSGWAGERQATLRRARHENFALLKSLTYEASLVEVFLYPVDTERLRASLKASLTGRDLPALELEVEGTIPKELLSRLAEGQTVEGAPEELVEAVERARTLWESKQDVAFMDRVVDEALMARQRAAARRWRCPFLASYFALVVDLTNLRSIVRARAAGWPPKEAGDLLLEGGTIEASSVAEAAGDGHEGWNVLLAGTPFETFIDLPQTPEEMEFSSERVRLGYLRTTREALEGIEPLLAFYLARERDITTLGTIGYGLDTGMPAEALRRRAGPLWWEC